MAAQIVERLREMTGPPTDAFWDAIKRQLDLSPMALDLAKVRRRRASPAPAPRQPRVRPASAPRQLPPICNACTAREVRERLCAHAPWRPQVAVEHVGVTEAKRHELVYIWSPEEGSTFDTVVLDAIVCFYRLREDKRRIQVRGRRGSEPLSGTRLHGWLPVGSAPVDGRPPETS